jgi:hypothetical protein
MSNVTWPQALPKFDFKTFWLSQTTFVGSTQPSTSVQASAPSSEEKEWVYIDDEKETAAKNAEEVRANLLLDELDKMFKPTLGDGFGSLDDE